MQRVFMRGKYMSSQMSYYGIWRLLSSLLMKNPLIVTVIVGTREAKKKWREAGLPIPPLLSLLPKKNSGDKRCIVKVHKKE